MSNNWELIKIGNLLTQVSRLEPVDILKKYKLLGIRLKGNGAFIRETKVGSQISAKTLSKVQSGDFIYSRLFAWGGAFDIVKSDLNECYVSNEFPTFKIISDRIYLKFLNLWFKLPATLATVESYCSGSTPLTRNRFKEKFFLNLEIPLPPIEEQRRIVTKVEELAGKIEEARSLREQTIKETEAIFGSDVERVVQYLTKKYESINLIDLVNQDRGISYGVVLTGQPHKNGIPTLRAGDLRKFHVLVKNVKSIDPFIEAKYKRTRICGGELLLKIRGGYGELAVCPPEMSGWNVSREIAVIPFTKKIISKYGMYVLSSPTNQIVMTEKLRGTSYVGINLKDVRKLAIPVPSIAEQQRIVNYLDRLQTKVDEMKRLREKALQELDALLPSILDKAFKGEL